MQARKSWLILPFRVIITGIRCSLNKGLANLFAWNHFWNRFILRHCIYNTECQIIGIQMGLTVYFYVWVTFQDIAFWFIIISPYMYFYHCPIWKLENSWKTLHGYCKLTYFLNSGSNLTNRSNLCLKFVSYISSLRERFQYDTGSSEPCEHVLPSETSWNPF